ncbi:MAG: hypothetical protein ACRCTE_12295 [Cellulosilyticaceae bacterium]
MKNNGRISANEINRFMYCPYQWYYKRTYGNKELTKRYKELGITTSNHESFYTKGTKHHTAYYRKYKLRRLIQVISWLIVLMMGAKWVMTWPF